MGYGALKFVHTNTDLWCSKVLEGESFMELIAASQKEEGGQHVNG